MPANVAITQDTSSAYAESDIAINPFNPLQIVASSNYDSGNANLTTYYSPDGGATWTQSTLPSAGTDPSGGTDDRQSDPAVGWTSDGTAWALAIGIDDPNVTLTVRSFRSKDGKNWTYDSAVSASTSVTDKPSLWVDRWSHYKDNMYAIWHQVAVAHVSVRNGPSGTWGTPLAVSGSETTSNADGGDIKTNAYGDVFAFWPDAGGQTLRVAKSTDGGLSFTALGMTPI